MSDAPLGMLIAPYLTTVMHAAAYVDADSIVGLESTAGEAGLRSIEGGRLTLKPLPAAAIRALELQSTCWRSFMADIRPSRSSLLSEIAMLRMLGNTRLT